MNPEPGPGEAAPGPPPGQRVDGPVVTVNPAGDNTDQADASPGGPA